jgi:hypothetical protein
MRICNKSDEDIAFEKVWANINFESFAQNFKILSERLGKLNSVLFYIITGTLKYALELLKEEKVEFMVMPIKASMD